MQQQKKTLRREMRSMLRKLGLNEKKEKSQQLCDALRKVLTREIAHNEMILGGFAPLSDEVSWLCLENDFKERIAFPGNTDLGMKFFKSSSQELIKSNGFGVEISSPREGSKECVPDILLIPGLAFDPSGKRLGRGKGFYDRYLGEFKGIKIGICFDEQIVKEIPTDHLDQKVDWVISDKRIYCGGNPTAL